MRQPFRSWLQGGRRWWRPLWDATRLWLREDCVDLSAAFAYHTLQSFFPALLIILSFFSLLLGRDGALAQQILDHVAEVLPPANMPAFELILNRFTHQGFGAGLLGVVLLILSANNIYLSLQRGSDRLWLCRPHLQASQPIAAVAIRFVGFRIKAFALLLLAALLLLLDQLLSNLRVFGLKVLHQFAVDLFPAPLQGLVSISMVADVSFSILTACTVSFLYLWLLPSRRFPPRTLVPPAILVGCALVMLNILLGRLLVSLSVHFQAYGVVGGVLILTLWIWLVGIILYFGQCLGVVLSGVRQGGRSVPAPLNVN